MVLKYGKLKRAKVESVLPVVCIENQLRFFSGHWMVHAWPCSNLPDRFRGNVNCRIQFSSHPLFFEPDTSYFVPWLEHCVVSISKPIVR